MHGKNTMSRRVTPQKIKRRLKAPTSTPAKPATETRIDIGDWSLAQDETGALFIHNVATGNRIVIARP